MARVEANSVQRKLNKIQTTNETVVAEPRWSSRTVTPHAAFFPTRAPHAALEMTQHSACVATAKNHWVPLNLEKGALLQLVLL